MDTLWSNLARYGRVTFWVWHSPMIGLDFSRRSERCVLALARLATANTCRGRRPWCAQASPRNVVRTRTAREPAASTHRHGGALQYRNQQLKSRCGECSHSAAGGVTPAPLRCLRQPESGRARRPRALGSYRQVPGGSAPGAVMSDDRPASHPMRELSAGGPRERPLDLSTMRPRRSRVPGRLPPAGQPSGAASGLCCRRPETQGHRSPAADVMAERDAHGTNMTSPTVRDAPGVWRLSTRLRELVESGAYLKVVAEPSRINVNAANPDSCFSSLTQTCRIGLL